MINIRFIKDRNNYYIGIVDKLNIYSYGTNINDIEEEIREEIIDLYKELLKLEDSQLGKSPREWKKMLIETFRNNNGIQYIKVLDQETGKFVQDELKDGESYNQRLKQLNKLLSQKVKNDDKK